jgi:DNA-binding response OmpR family regulator
VVASVATLEAAWAALSRGNFDCAVVDLNLHDESALPVAEALLDERKPLLIATGYDGGVLTDRLKDVARVEKPFEPAQLIRVLEQSIGEPG